jgi:hypothetical protein
MCEMDAVPGQHRHVAVGQEEHVASVAQNRRNIRRHEILAVSQSHHHRRPRSRGHNLIRILARDHAQREHSRQLPHRVAYGILQVAVVVLLHQVRDHFRVRLGAELVAFFHQLMLQRQIIFDDTVVHHHDVAMAVAMRMRVLLGRPPVRGPASMPDPVQPLQRIQLQDVFQIAQFALCAAHFQAVALLHRDPRRVIPAVFQPFQAVKNNRHGLPRSDVANDSAY